MNVISNATSVMSNVLNARAERIIADLEDRVEIAHRAEEMQKLEEMRKDAPRIDWENRTYKEKIPDTWHKDPPPEMLSGE